ncbi:MAG TPA: TlyA family RNA methyltransferase [Tepidisphaeraceae bacterium]|nr:TlyA family RNA methyltransferase [Tepidisphaeraceae bacterium]
MSEFVSRAGLKLEHAVATFGIEVAGLICADLGSNVGGFVDCLLRRGATKVYSIDTGYGVLDWKLRNDPRVVVMERTNAMHVTLPEPVDFVSIDVAWTKQRHILPAARRLLTFTGQVVTLIKPHYEAPTPLLRKGVLQPEKLDEVIEMVKADIAKAGFSLLGLSPSPIKGAKGNIEYLAHLRPTATTEAAALPHD